MTERRTFDAVIREGPGDMMRRRVRASIVALFLTSLVPASAPAQRVDLQRLEAVADSVVADHLDVRRSPGVSVAIGVDGEVVFARGYGRAAVELDVPATPRSVYRIGSITKQFTAAAIMRLVEAVDLSLDDPITDYLPDYPTQGGHAFVPTFDDAVRLVFTVEEGRATRVTLYQGGAVVPGKRKP
jgi:CubicO group peptidase (beta-lactamase class C family)